jgi:phage portal protein BeeE
VSNLTRRQADYITHGRDVDMVLDDRARSLAKRAWDGVERQSGRRRRTVPNVWATFEGRGQPRQGFLSTEIMRMTYLRSEVVRACVDTLVELVCGCDWNIRPCDEEKSKWMRDRKPEQYRDQKKRIRWLEKFFKKPAPHHTLDGFHRLLLRDLLIYDAAAYEVVMAEVNGRSLPLELGLIAGDTVEIDCDESGIPLAYWQSYNVVTNVDFTTDELAYIMLNPVSWSPYGVSPIETAYVSIASDLNANKYNASYFEKNGIPPALLAVMGLSSGEFRSLMSQMRQTSQDNPWNIHAFRAARDADGKSQQVFDLVPLSTVSNKEMQFTELLTHVVRRITMLYRTSPSQIGFTDEITGGIGSGVAETQVDLMESKGVAPLLRKLAETHTEMVVHNACGWEDLEFAFAQSQTPKEQQEYQQDAGEVTMGAMTINELRAKHGGRDSVPWGDQPLTPTVGYTPPMSPDQMMQQMQQAQMGMGQPGQPGQPPQLGQSPYPPGPPDGPQPELAKSGDRDRSIIIRI